MQLSVAADENQEQDERAIAAHAWSRCPLLHTKRQNANYDSARAWLAHPVTPPVIRTRSARTTPTADCSSHWGPPAASVTVCRSHALADRACGRVSAVRQAGIS